MSAWWALRTPRERGLLAVMLVLIGIVLAWVAVIQPLADALDAAKARHGAAVVALAEARARTRPASTAAAAGPADAIAEQTASAAGFTGARIGSQGPARASVAIDAARPQALFGWIAEMERRGLVVERLSARANADQTLSAEVGVKAGRR
ncbi:MAG TPA: type II secretion system protein GspM [Allosphingosinicella sp.]|nr:type II secretion system protein GspM [Allosphingosinicella sp.]